MVEVQALPTTRRPRDRELLHRIARQLEPDELPFYVAHPTRPGQLIGWYWQPKGAAAPEPLGSNVYMAHTLLLSLVNGDG